ncbi:hypothetical protein [Nocardia harenae]|uniref:hypothetical protein n=1 Tax=Nocardia harenae TaxID=358707 RepID=UPI0008358DC7|nr:hypothetical protein [Nocardia harenae]
MVCCLLAAQLGVLLRGFFAPVRGQGERRPRPRASVVALAVGELGILAVLVLAIASARPGASSSTAESAHVHDVSHVGMSHGANHVVWMAALALATTVIPLTVLAATETALPRLRELALRVPAWLDAVIWITVLVVWHLPVVHATVSGSVWRTAVLAVLTAVVSLPVWARVSDLLRRAPQVAATTWVPLLAAFEISMVFGAALVASPAGWVPGAGAVPIAEQRLSGLLMLVVDIAALVHLFRRERGTAEIDSLFTAFVRTPREGTR